MAFNFIGAGKSSIPVTFIDVHTPATKDLVFAGVVSNKTPNTVKAYLTREVLGVQTFSHVWQVDDTPADTAFVDETADANSAAAADWQLFPTTEAIGDYASFGMPNRYSQITFNYAGGTAGTVGVVAWEYWNGTAWVALAGVTDATSSFTTAVADGLVVSWSIPADWQVRTISTSASLYWIRARVTTLYTINPVMDDGVPALSYRNELDGVDVPSGSSLKMPKMSLAINESVQIAASVADALDVSVEIISDVT